MKIKPVLFILLLFQLSAWSQPVIEWQKSLGGSSDDKAFAVQQTFDGGYIVAGYSLSNDSEVTGNHGGDYWIVKLDASGIIQWDKCYGGTGVDWPYSIKQTTDSGYFVVGYTTSKDGDVTGLHGVNADYWALKLSSTGNIEWEKCLGGTGDDKAYSGQQTKDGGYIVAGYSGSKDGDVTGNHSIFTGSDDWIVKLSSIGDIQWEQCYGGSANDYAESIYQTFDSGYIVAGYTYSNDSEVSGNHSYPDYSGYPDYWVIKIDKNGGLEWQKCLGGSQLDEAWSIQQTADSGYIVAGETASNDSEVSGNHWVDGPYADYWVVKLSAPGDIQWQKCYGGNADDWAQSIQQTTDGGYVIAGIVYSHDGEVNPTHPVGAYPDYWIVKTDSTGAIQWKECLGGSADDEAYAVQQTADGGFIVAGYSNSTDYDVTGNHGGYDYWIVKLAGPLGITEKKSFGAVLNIYPDPSSVSLSVQLSKDGNEEAVFQIFDMFGKEVLKDGSFTNKSEGGAKTINISALSPGMYLLQAKTTKGIVAQKFIKE